MMKFLRTVLRGGLSLAVLLAASEATCEAGIKSVDYSTDTTAHYSAGVADVLKMLDAKVDPGVIKAYINSSSVIYSPNASEIIALKQRGVPDEILTAMLERGAEVRVQALRAMQMAPPPAQSSYGPQPNEYAQPQAPAADYGYDYGYPSYSDYSYPYYYPNTYSYSYYNWGWPWWYSSWWWPYYSGGFFNRGFDRDDFRFGRFHDFDRFGRFNRFAGRNSFGGRQAWAPARGWSGYHPGFASGRTFTGSHPMMTSRQAFSGGFHAAPAGGGFRGGGGGFRGGGGFGGHAMGGGGFGGHAMGGGGRR